jgi:FtsZ-binding cell division protein ZapB
MSEEKVVDALVESNDLLQEEVTRLRETNTMLRRVNRALRRTLDSLRNQVAAAAENDETFKAFCAGEFDEQVIETEGAGLAESVSQVEARG